MIHGISQHDFYFIFEHVTCFILINMETAIFLAHLVQYEMVFLEYLSMNFYMVLLLFN